MIMDEYLNKLMEENRPEIGSDGSVRLYDDATNTMYTIHVKNEEYEITSPYGNVCSIPASEAPEFTSRLAKELDKAKDGAEKLLVELNRIYEDLHCVLQVAAEQEQG